MLRANVASLLCPAKALTHQAPRAWSPLSALPERVPSGARRVRVCVSRKTSVSKECLGFGEFGPVGVGARHGDQFAIRIARLCRVAGLLGRPRDPEDAAEAVPFGAHGLLVFL